MRNSYHGRSFGAVAITGNAGWKSSRWPVRRALPARHGPELPGFAA
jgi:acetylornithine/succinyldiaminopimelate/putrescine aminotransferase